MRRSQGWSGANWKVLFSSCRFCNKINEIIKLEYLIESESRSHVRIFFCHLLPSNKVDRETFLIRFTLLIVASALKWIFHVKRRIIGKNRMIHSKTIARWLLSSFRSDNHVELSAGLDSTFSNTHNKHWCSSQSNKKFMTQRSSSK